MTFAGKQIELAVIAKQNEPDWERQTHCVFSCMLWLLSSIVNLVGFRMSLKTNVWAWACLRGFLYVRLIKVVDICHTTSTVDNWGARGIAACTLQRRQRYHTWTAWDVYSFLCYKLYVVVQLLNNLPGYWLALLTKIHRAESLMVFSDLWQASAVVALKLFLHALGFAKGRCIL